MRPSLPFFAFMLGIVALPPVGGFAQISGESEPLRDLKGTLFAFVLPPATTLGPSAEDFNARLSECFAILGLRTAFIENTDSAKVAASLQTYDRDPGNQIAGIVEFRFPDDQAVPASPIVEVYRYPFPPIAPVHISSPHYDHKFGSDSALLAIELERAVRRNAESRDHDPLQNLEIRFADDFDPVFSAAQSSRTIRIICPPKTLETAITIETLAETLAATADAYVRNATCAAMGRVPSKALRHAEMPNIEIRVFRYLYPERDYSEDEQKQRLAETTTPIAVVRPFASGLYYVADLEPITPYTIKFVDPTRPENDFWHELDEAAFVTSSVGGVVRTVPGRHGDPVMPSDETSVPVSRTPTQTEVSPQKADFVIVGATVIDGTRNANRYIADVAVVGGKIFAIGDLHDLPRDFAIPASGLYLTPGFIDIHSHADEDVLKVPDAPTHVRQGITTVLGGNCSFSPLGIGAFLREIEQRGMALNLGVLIGNGPVRRRVLGKRTGVPEYSAIYREKELVDLAMEEGAFGLSSGLIYEISEEADAWELAELAKQCKPYGGFYASHIRGETDEGLDAVREAIHIGEIAEVPVQVSHLKALRKQNWGRMADYLEAIRSARSRGLDVAGDQYPWRASGPAAHYDLYTLLVREAIKNESPETVLLKDMPGKYAKYSGRPLTDLLAAENMTPEDLVRDLNLTKDTPIFATFLCLSDEDVCAAMRVDFVMVCTDSGLVSQEDIDAGRCRDEHPRKFRTYPEFLAKYVRDRGVCSWELAIHKCTGLPAARMKLTDRGIIRPGACADLVLFDPAKLDPGADFRDQAQPPRGIQWVFINGRPALREAELTNFRAGQALYGYGNRKP